MFDNTNVIASMATGGMDMVREVNLPHDLAIINLIEVGEVVVTNYDCPVWKVFQGAVDAPYFDGGYTYMQELCGTCVDLIEPTSWAIFDFTVMQLRYEKPAANQSWWSLPRNEIADSISAYRKHHGLKTTDQRMNVIMKWVDYNLNLINME